MDGGIDGIGEAVTAGLVAKAAEPGHGIYASHAADSRCMNCGATLVGPHCHRCGQKADVHRSFGAIGHDLLHAIFHFEGKIWNTLPLLSWRPGDLTRRYMHGERARFISPLALFLLSVFLTYAVLALVGSGQSQNHTAADVAQAIKEQEELSAVRSRLDGEVAKLDAKLAVPGLTAADKQGLKAQRRSLIESGRMIGLVDEKADPDHIRQDIAGEYKLANVQTGIAFIDKAINKANANPSLLLYKLQANAYKFAWALIPLSLPFMWLLYPFSRRFHVYDHFVFVTYSISFMLLLFVAVRLLNLTALGDAATTFAVLYVPFHMYRQMRGAYRSSRWGAALRMILLLFFSLFAVILFMSLLLTMGLMG